MLKFVIVVEKQVPVAFGIALFVVIMPANWLFDLTGLILLIGLENGLIRINQEVVAVV
jgi:hypothetical protein